MKERKKDQLKKDKGSKIYSKNPFEALNDSDWFFGREYNVECT